MALSLKRFAVAAMPALLGIILHEVAHGWMAERRGDPTARLLGRITLNPLPHIDIMGLLVFGVTSLSGSFVFGWAKPVPVDTRYFRQPAKDLMLVSLAGPTSNFLLALAFALLLRALIAVLPAHEWASNSVWVFAVLMLHTGVIINFGLGWLNLLPVPPLDGSKVLAYFLPPQLAQPYMALERYGFVILLILLFTGALGYVLGPLILTSKDILFAVTGLR